MAPLTVLRFAFSSSEPAFSLLETDRLVGDEGACELLEFIPDSFIALRPAVPFARLPMGRTVPKSHRSSSSLFLDGESSR